MKEKLKAGNVKIQQTEGKTKELEDAMDTLKKDKKIYEEHMIRTDCHLTEPHLHLRGVPETNTDDRMEVITLLAEYMGPDKMENQVDMVLQSELFVRKTKKYTEIYHNSTTNKETERTNNEEAIYRSIGGGWEDG